MYTSICILDLSRDLKPDTISVEKNHDEGYLPMYLQPNLQFEPCPHLHPQAALSLVTKQLLQEPVLLLLLLEQALALLLFLTLIALRLSLGVLAAAVEGGVGRGVLLGHVTELGTVIELAWRSYQTHEIAMIARQ